MKPTWRALWLLVLTALLAACADDNPNPRRDVAQALPHFDLQRYMGRWYNIAHVDYIGERGFVASYSEWTLQPDGKISDAFVGRKGSFHAEETRSTFTDEVEPGTGNARWHVHLLGPITVQQLTLYVDPDYRYTILGYPNKSLAWIFARTPEVAPEVYADMVHRLDQLGYDTSKLMRVPQKPEDLGQPGYLPGEP